MPRTVDSWSVVGSVLTRVLAVAPPAWVRPRTVAHFEAALASLRSDALDVVADADTRAAPTILGMGRTQFMAARAPGGWLATHAARATPNRRRPRPP